MRKESPETAMERIKRGQIPGILFLYGQDETRLLRFVEELRRRCLGDAIREFNENVFDASEVQIETIIEAAQTHPVLSEYRVVIVRNAEALGKQDWEKVSAYLSDPSPSTCLIFRGKTLPTHRSAHGALESHGSALEFRPRSVRDAASWASRCVAREGKRILPEAARALVERVGTHQGPLEEEIQKLIAYVGDRPIIHEEDVHEVAAEAKVQRIFDLTDALSEHRTAEAIKVLHRLLEDGTPPLNILGMMARQIRLLWQAGDTIRRGRTPEEAGFSSLPDFLRQRVAKQARSWDEASLESAMEGLARIDHAIKSGGIKPEILFDEWILRIGRGRIRSSAH